MKKLKYILLSLAFIGTLVGGVLLYKNLSSFYSNNDHLLDNPDEENQNEKGEDSPSTIRLAKDFSVYDIEGNQAKLSDNIGKPVIVNFWATWCHYCVEELPIFEKLYKEYKDQITFMMVDLPDISETKSVVLKFIGDNKYTFPVYFDNDNSAYDAYSCSSIPRTLIVNKNGSQKRLYVGAMDETTLRYYCEAITK